MGRSRYGYFDGYWPRYQSVAERAAEAQRTIKALGKKGKMLNPVKISGRLIARSFWGKRWCTHLESFRDYDNRLPRGRSYVRNGHVFDLNIGRCVIKAQLASSSIYQVRIDIKPLTATRWRSLKRQCASQIGSLIELLQGQLSDQVIETMIDPRNGLFPRKKEIRYRCNCPDWAEMCKHVAAAMYGVGSRLDQQPDMLFVLRGVDHNELINIDAQVDRITENRSARAQRANFSDQQLEQLFKLSDAEPASADVPAAGQDEPFDHKQPEPFVATARSIAQLRRKLNMNKSEFARAVGVSSMTVSHWEQAGGALNLRLRSRRGIERLLEGMTIEDTGP